MTAMSPLRMLLTVLAIVFVIETVVMLILMAVFPAGTPAAVESLLDAALMTLFSAPLLWWTVARPLLGEAAAEHANAESIVGRRGRRHHHDRRSGAGSRLFNRAAEGIFGYRAVEVVGQEVALLIPDRLMRQYAEGLRDLPGDRTIPADRPDDGAVRPQEGRTVACPWPCR